MPDAASTPNTEALALQQAADEASALKELSKATGRAGKLLGLNIAAAVNANPAKTEIAIAILGERKSALKVSSATKAGAALNAAGFLNHLSDAVEQRLASKHPIRQPTEKKPLPEILPQHPPTLKRIGS